VPATECNYNDSKLAVSVGSQSEPGAVTIFAGSRNRWITPGADNYGFAAWVKENADELALLGPGRHFGEWWGRGINRGYGQTERRFSLFNVSRWLPKLPGNPFCGVYSAPKEGEALVQLDCCHVVPTIWRGLFDTGEINDFIEMLRIEGSFAAPGFKNPEGIVIFHTAQGNLFKKTLKDDEKPKSLSNPTVV